MRLEGFRGYIFVLKTMFGRQKWQILLLTALGFLNGLLDSIGIGMLIPLFSIIAKDSSATANRISDLVGQFFSIVGIGLNLRSILFFMAGVFVVKAISEFVVGYIRIQITTKYENELRNTLYEQTLMARWPYLMRQKIGHLENILMSDVHATMGMFNRLCYTAPSIASFLVYLTVALQTSFLVTIITMGVGGVILLLTRSVTRRLKSYTALITEMNKMVAHRVNENVQGMKMVKALAIEGEVAKSEINVFDNLRRTIIKSALVKQVSTGFMEPIIFLFIAGIFAFSYSKPEFSIGGFVVVMYLIQRLFNSVARLQGSFLALSESMPYVAHVIKLEQAVAKEKEEDTGHLPFVFESAIQFKDVSFGYEPEKPVLDGISFSIKKNEMIGIIGPSGAGKTTIADLLLRLFHPDRGEILIDGNNISLIKLEWLRQHIGYVSQEVFLKNDTIQQNIRFYAADITEADIIHAAKMANIYDFIMGLPKGFQSTIGDRGILLSGGQRQRIALARMLARKPKILILDEATSALDNESESLIRTSIDGLKGGITAIIIAHRLSTVMNCDRLFALEEGKIVEEGTPQELLKNEQSYFYRMHHLS